MTIYNTGNPVPSADARDRYDNSLTFDELMNGGEQYYPNRRGRLNLSAAGMATLFATAQQNRQDVYDQFLLSMGYEVIGDYASQPVTFTARNQVMLKDGEFFKPKAFVALPYVTTGNWVSESGIFISVGDAALRQELQGASGSDLVSYTVNADGGVTVTLSDKLSRSLGVDEFGVIGDGGYHPLSERYGTLAAAQAKYPFVTSLTQTIDWAAGQALLNARKTVPGEAHFYDYKLMTAHPLTWKGGAFMKGVPGRCAITLAPGSNCSILVSENFDDWAAWVPGMSNLGYPMDGGIDGILLDGNAGEQTAPPTSAADMQYGMRIHSHRFGVGWLQIRRMNGVGSLTQYNAALMFSFRTDGVDDYGLQGSPLGSPSPYDFKQINVIDCLYEHFVFRGPADIPIWHLTTNYCGWLDNATIPTTARTSLLFPGEEIHSVRIETACKAGYLNLNGALYGRSLYVAPFTRFHADTAILTGSWGACLISGAAFGSIAALSLQQNTYAWGGVYKPCLEIPFATGSAGGLCRFSFPQVSLRRLTTPITPNAIGPGILDNAGAQFGIIDGIDSNAVAGHGLVIGATNRRGVYESVNFDSLIGTAADGTASAAVMVESGARDWRIEQLQTTNCDRGFVNKGVGMRGIVRDGLIECSASQVALEGVVANSQVAGVIPGVGNISLDNISSWGLELLFNSTRYYNRFKTTATFVGSTAGSQVLAPIAHSMWRRPDPRDIKTAILFSGTTWPDFNAGVRSPTNNNEIVPAAFVHTAAPGSIVMAIELS